MRILIVLTLIFLGCNRTQENKDIADKSNFVVLKYAEGFSARYEGGHIWLSVNKPYQNAERPFKYVLVKKGEEIPEHDTETEVIFIPIEKIVCTSTTHIPLLDYLNVSESLVGFPTTDYISSVKTRKLIDDGKVTDLGIDHSLNVELLLLLNPDLVMAYTVSGDMGHYKKIKESGIPVVINAEYLEKHPLGRAEWIKFAGLFYGKEKEADSVFNIIEQSYLEAVHLTESLSDKPTVMSGVMYGDSWFLPAGENYASRLFKDAGLSYLWENEPGTGFIPLSFESVYAKANAADYWIGVASFATLKEISSTDKRYEWFKPFKHKHVYTYNARIGAKGGSEYLELGYLRPDIIVKDLIHIAYPELLPEHQMYFFGKLE